jgi:hypothetical protein
MTSDVRIYKNVIASPAKESWSSHHFLFDEHGENIPARPHFGFTRIHLLGLNPPWLPKSFGIPEPQRVISRAVFGGWYAVYFGHFITDALARMWYCRDKEDVYFFPIDHTFLDFGGQRIDEFAEVIGFDVDKFRWILQATLFQELVVPEPAFDERVQPNELWSRFTKTLNWQSSIEGFPEKIYFTRGDPRSYRKASIFGESAFWKYLESQGFHVVDTSITTIQDQRAFIQNAKITVTPEGSAAYWAMFLEPKNQQFIILARRPEWSQSGITGQMLVDISSRWVKTTLIDRVVTAVGPEDWSNKSVFVNWELISQDLKGLGLVDSVYQENGASRDDALAYLSIHGGRELRQKIEDVLEDYA